MKCVIKQQLDNWTFIHELITIIKENYHISREKSIFPTVGKR